MATRKPKSSKAKSLSSSAPDVVGALTAPEVEAPAKAPATVALDQVAETLANAETAHRSHLLPMMKQAAAKLAEARGLLGV